MEDCLSIRCPNCGSLAQRRLSDRLPAGSQFSAKLISQTECSVCDYFMVTCWEDGTVLEAYAPGTSGGTFKRAKSRATMVLLPLNLAYSWSPDRHRSDPLTKTPS